MPKHKPVPVSAVPVDLCINAFSQINEDHETYGSAGADVAIVKSLAKTNSSDHLIATSYRLHALSKLIREGHSGKWTIPILHDDRRLVNEALVRAAARAPLFTAGTVGQVSFDPETFLEIVFEESEAEGSG